MKLAGALLKRRDEAQIIRAFERKGGGVGQRELEGVLHDVRDPVGGRDASGSDDADGGHRRGYAMAGYMPSRQGAPKRRKYGNARACEGARTAGPWHAGTRPI
jgi:hypothetical protein